MATIVPAQLAGADKQIESLSKGMYVDLRLIRRNAAARANRALLYASPADFRLVVIGGVPVLWRPGLDGQSLPQIELEHLTVCGVWKKLYIKPYPAIADTAKTFKQISSELQSQLSEWGTSLRNSPRRRFESKSICFAAISGSRLRS